MSFALDFAYAWGAPEQQAVLKSQPEDFIVDELFAFEPAGVGEHLYLHIRKTGENTQFLADALATFFGVKKMDIGVAGMKDRNAVTSQWFSCYLPGNEQQFDVNTFIQQTNLKIALLDQIRHTQKLRRGDHQGNTFNICLREIAQNDESERRLQHIKNVGVPNYFGSQRFGHDGNNLQQFNEKIERDTRSRSRSGHKHKRNKSSMLISAARSYLFNLVLAERIRQDNWQKALPGEVVVGDSITGPLWGRGRSPVQETVKEIEEQTLASMQSWCTALEHSGLQQERRALKLMPQNFSWQWEAEALRLTFQLAPGQYATSVLREICGLRDTRKPTKNTP